MRFLSIARGEVVGYRAVTFLRIRGAIGRSSGTTGSSAFRFGISFAIFYSCPSELEPRVIDGPKNSAARVETTAAADKGGVKQQVSGHVSRRPMDHISHWRERAKMIRTVHSHSPGPCEPLSHARAHWPATRKNLQFGELALSRWAIVGAGSWIESMEVGSVARRAASARCLGAVITIEQSGRRSQTSQNGSSQTVTAASDQ